MFIGGEKGVLGQILRGEVVAGHAEAEGEYEIFIVLHPSQERSARVDLSRLPSSFLYYNECIGINSYPHT